MRIQLKILILVSLCFVGTISAIVWKTRTLLVKDRISLIADSSMKQIAPFKRLVKERLDEKKSKLVQYASSRAGSGAAVAHIPDDFEAVALMQFSTATQQWAPVWFDKNGTTQSDLPAGFEQTLLKSLTYPRIKDVEELWARLSDHQGAAIYALAFSVDVQAARTATAAPTGQAQAGAESALPEAADYGANANAPGAAANGMQRAVLVALTASDMLAGVTEDYIGSTSAVYLVDDKGYVASHVNKAYLGSLFTEDPLVAEVIKSKKTVASGNYDDLENRSVLGHFESIRGTNLYAVISTPLLATQEIASGYVLTSLSIGLIMTFVSIILLYFYIGRVVIEPLKMAISAVHAVNRGEPLHISASGGNDEVGHLLQLLSESSPAALLSKAGFTSGASSPQLAMERKSMGPLPTQHVSLDETDSRVNVAVDGPSEAQNETELIGEKTRRQVYETFREGLSGAIKEPLLSIIGHAQLARTKSENSEVTAHADSIEREARRATGVLDRMKNWVNTDTASPHLAERVDLKTIVETLLDQRKDEFAAESIYVSSELQKVPKVRGSVEQMSVAFSNLLDNAREALQARPKKHLRVQLDYLNDQLFLVVSDTGVGMTRDLKLHAFEPFVKGFETSGRLGLGLSLVNSTVKHMGGTCSIESTPGEGATVTLKIPVSAEEKQLFRLDQDMGAKPVAEIARVSLPLTPPPIRHRVTTTVAPPEPQGAAEVTAAVTAAVTPQPPPRITSEVAPQPPAGASVRDQLEAHSNPSIVSDVSLGDDEDEPFSEVHLHAPQNQPAARLGESVSSVAQNENSSTFHVKIRSPRARS